MSKVSDEKNKPASLRHSRRRDGSDSGSAGRASEVPAEGELQRRHRSILSKETDLVRWRDPQQLEPAWERRSEIAAQYIRAGSRVLDLGCGAMTLERHLPYGCSYMPCDVVARDQRTRVCNLNENEFPEDLISDADIVTMLGVVEYVFDPAELFRRLREYRRPLLVSYCANDNDLAVPREDLGWVNDLSLEQFRGLLNAAGFNVVRCDRIDSLQWIFLAFPDLRKIQPSNESKRALVLTYNNVGNFGDRLGFHLINSVLPTSCECTFANFNPWNVPETEFDLLILGVGNSIFEPMITPQLLALLDRVPRRIGIFGTQYRDGALMLKIASVLDRLDHWYARYEEDVDLYGRGRPNVSHLGDWLIDAFPMSRWKDERALRIGSEIWNEMPLDRTIQQIQAYRRVTSSRLHPLLCALTSAEQVAYSEQREFSGERGSGKFRSMLLDVFKREFVENAFWEVERPLVLAYKGYVRRQIESLKSDLAA